MYSKLPPDDEQLICSKHVEDNYLNNLREKSRRTMENHPSEVNRKSDKKEKNGIGLDTHYVKKQEQ